MYVLKVTTFLISKGERISFSQSDKHIHFSAIPVTTNSAPIIPLLDYHSGQISNCCKAYCHWNFPSRKYTHTDSSSMIVPADYYFFPYTNLLCQNFPFLTYDIPRKADLSSRFHISDHIPVLAQKRKATILIFLLDFVQKRT